MLLCSFWSLNDMVTWQKKLHENMCLKRPQICQFSFFCQTISLKRSRFFLFPSFLSPPPLLFLYLRVTQHVFCCQKGLCLCYVNVGWRVWCRKAEISALRVLSSVQREISADSRSRLLCVVEILRPCVLTFEVGFGSPHFIITIKMSIRKQNLEMNRVLEIPSGHKHADRTRTSLVFTKQKH